MAQTTIVKTGQSWWDIAIELTGAWEAGVDLALSLGVSMTAAPAVGTELKAQKTYHRPMEQYCHAEGVSPATLDEDASRPWQIFSSTFNIVYQ